MTTRLSLLLAVLCFSSWGQIVTNPGGGGGGVSSVGTGCGTSGGAITTTGTIIARELVNAQTGTTYTYLDGDCGKLVTHTNGSAIAGTLPQANGSTFKSGWFMDVQNRGAGTLTITPTTSTVDGAATLVLAANQGARIVSDGTNYFTQRGVGGGASSGSGPVYTTTTYSSTPTFNVSTSTIQVFTITMTGDVASSTLSGSLTNGQDITFNICQDSTGSRTFVWPTNVTEAGTVDPTLSTCSRQTFRYDGTNAIAVTPMTCPACAPGLTIPGSSSGSTNLIAAAAASGTVTLPAATDTLVGKATTDALTNKTYNGLTITTTTGTFALAAGKVITINNTITLAGTDGATYTFPTTSQTVPGMNQVNTGGGAMTWDLGAALRTAPMKIGTTPPATCAVGDLFYDSDATAGQNLLGCTATNTWTAQGGAPSSGGSAGIPLFAQTASVTVTNTTSETSLDGTVAGSKTIPASWFSAIGTTLDVCFGGYLSGDAATPGTLRLKMKFGSTVMADTGAVTLPASIPANSNFGGCVRFTARTIGGSGTIIANAPVGFGLTLVGLGLGFINTSAVTVDTTATQAFTFTAQWGSADSDNSITLSNLVASSPGNADRSGGFQGTIGDGVNVISTGIAFGVRATYACTMTGVTMAATQASATGSIVVDLWKDTYANFPPVVGDSIAGAALPTITSSNKSTDTTLTGWTKTVAIGDWIIFNVNSASGLKQVQISVDCPRN